MKPPKRTSTRGTNEEATQQVKRARKNLLPPFPPEVWELIFRNLNGYWLKLARLTCSNWNQIILGSTRLMDKFVLSLTATHFAQHRKQVRALLATGGYVRAVFHFYGIGNNKPRVNWLVPLGMTLHTLSVETSGTLLLLAQILKETPNLKRLDIIMDNQSSIDVVPDFLLEKLEELNIRCLTCPVKLTRFCRQICPRLTALNMFSSSSKDNYQQECIAFVKGVCQTLQEFESSLSLAIVSALEKMDTLRLNRANLSGSSEHCLRFIRSQPNLVSLDISRGYGDLAVEDLNEILTTLPTLKSLTVRFKTYESQPSLSCTTPSNIESLCIKYGHSGIYTQFRLNLSIRNLPKLRHLSLTRCNISRRSLRDLEEANLSSLTLERCYIKRLPDLFLLTSLQHLELGSNRIGNMPEPEPAEDVTCAVRSLKVTHVDRAVCLAVVNLFRDLEQFDAGDGVEIDKGMLEELSRNSPRLKRLRLTGCRYAVDCPSEAVHLFDDLETFFIMCPVDVFEELSDTFDGVRGRVEIRLQGMRNR